MPATGIENGIEEFSAMAMELVTEEIVRRVAKIMGPSSAAAKAIRDFEDRQEAGENVAFYHEPRTWIVGPICVCE